MTKNNKRDLWLVFITLALVLCIITAIKYNAFEHDESGFWVTLTDIVYVISGAVTTAALSALAYDWYSNRDVNKKKTLFMKLFGITDINNVVVVLPRYRVDAFSQLTKQDESTIHAVKAFGEAGQKGLAWDDVIAMREIGRLFSAVNLPEPQAVFDHQAATILMNKESDNEDGIDRDRRTLIKNAKVFFVIGIFSNELTARINMYKQETCFRFPTKELVARGLRGVNMPERFDNDSARTEYENWKADWKNSINDYDKWVALPGIRKLAPDSTGDLAEEGFGLIARLMHDGSTIYIIGGEHARHTRKTAVHFRENWETIMTDRGTLKASVTNFAYSCKIPRKRTEEENVDGIKKPLTGRGSGVYISYDEASVENSSET